MKLVTVLMMIFFLAYAYSGDESPTLAESESSQTLSEASIDKLFHDWMLEYGRKYSSSDEMKKRRDLFKKQLEHMDKFNSDDASPTLFDSETNSYEYDDFEAIPVLSEAYIHHVFKEWMAKHERNYSTTNEMIKRREIFKKNLHHIRKFNSEGHSYTKGINQFTDYDDSDFVSCALDDDFSDSSPEMKKRREIKKLGTY